MTNLSPDKQQKTIRRLSQEWIEQGFSPEEDTQNYTYEQYFAPYYDPRVNASKKGGKML